MAKRCNFEHPSALLVSDGGTAIRKNLRTWVEITALHASGGGGVGGPPPPRGGGGCGGEVFGAPVGARG
jgi:hypothetical protein